MKLCVLLIAGVAAAQAPAFEAAAIKPNKSATAIGGRGGCGPRGTVSFTGKPLGMIIQESYGIRDVQLLGRPSWLDSERFDVEARPPQGTTFAQCKLMMQNLLAERFGLKAHRETRELPVYRLTVLKGGHKMRPGKVDAGARTFSTTTGQLLSAGLTMEQLARMLASVREVEKFVIDATALTGVYEFELNWAPQGLTPDGTSGPSVFTALQEQLGLKLEAGRGPVDVLVIDHINRQPTEN